MLLKSLAATYAEAAMGSLEPEQYSEASEDLTTFAGLYASEPRIKLLLGNPAIPDDDKKKLVMSIADRGRFLESTKHLLLLLLENDRMGLVTGIAESFREHMRKRERKEVAKVTCAVELSGEQLDRLSRKLSGYVGKDVEIEVTVNRSLIGGMVIRVGDKIIDSSMENTLGTLRESLIEGL